MKTWATRIHETGGPEVLRWEEVDLPAPGEGQLLVRTAAAGLNFIDVYHRSGLYPLGLPSGIGLEAAAVVEEVGEGVSGFGKGDRVGYCVAGLGAYAECRLVDSARVVRLPDNVDYRTAAAMLLKGQTAEYLIRRTFLVRPEHTVLFYAAAGGVGQIACQWLKQVGATVVGVVGSDAKAEVAKGLGCDEVLIQGRDDIPARVREITGGRGADVAYDSVGKDTFMDSVNSLAPRGLLVSFGNASGPVDPFSPSLLGEKGSLFLTRPSLMAYMATPEEIRDSARALFDAHERGVKITVGQTYPLREAHEAHRDLEARKTTGSTVLLP